MLDIELPSGNEVKANFVGAGFVLKHHEIVSGADSFLARLPDTEFEQGMAALLAHLANMDSDQIVTEEIDWFVFTKAA